MSAPAAVHNGLSATGIAAAERRRLTTVPPEEELLLLTSGGAENDASIRDVGASGIDWQRFLGLAQIERAVPVVYPRVRAVLGEHVAADVLNLMRRLAMVSDFTILHLESRLRDSLRVLHDAGVRVMLLKGAALAHTAYAGMRHRPMSDLDVLVDPSNAQTARRIMLSAGWRDFVGGIPRDVYDHHHHLPPLHDTRAPELQLEIHTALFPERQPFTFSVGELWARAVRLGPELSAAFAPDPVHSLLHACLHFVWSHQGRFGVWRTIRDVDALTQRGSVDWNRFVAVARGSRGGTSCYWTLRIAALAAGVAVPASVFDELRPRRSAYVLRALERHLVRNLFPVEFECPSVMLDHALWELAIMPRKSGHGRIRPWDEEDDFVPAPLPSSDLASGGVKRRARLGAAVRYVATLLRT
jgi:hypothetical protein